MMTVKLTTAIAVLGAGIVTTNVASANALNFDLVTSAGASTCLPDARGYVRIVNRGPVEFMTVAIQGLPSQTEFDLFVIQVPDPPFGLSWYQGDIETNSHGWGHGLFVGRFNEETFTVAPGAAVAPLVHNKAFPDVNTNPATGPVHQYHLGIWFNSADDAKAAGCPDNVTPFNGEHNAGIQVLNTSNFPIEQGPLFDLKP